MRFPIARPTERWVERTPGDFVFNVKAHALMTGHATDVARLPRLIRDEIRAVPTRAERLRERSSRRSCATKSGAFSVVAVEPLHEAGKLGAILLQFAPWIRPGATHASHAHRAREQLGDLPIAVEFRHPSWLEPRLRERVWGQLRDHGMTYVVADTPPGTPTSLPLVPAITTPGARDRAAAWTAKRALGRARCARSSRSIGTSIDRTSSRIGSTVILELADQAERVHVVFNNCYANYGTTNALRWPD